MKPVVGRVPIPTGRIHIGNFRLAPLNWLFARRNGGTLLGRRRKRPLAQRLSAVYDRAALKRNAEECQELKSAGRAQDWRIFLQDRTVAWQDLIYGPQTIEESSLSDPVLVRAGGQALSNRLRSLSIRSFRQEGLEPLAVLSHSAMIGTSHAAVPYKSLNALAPLFDFDKLSRAPARFDIDELKSVNARLLQELRYREVAGRLDAAAIGAGEAFWNDVRGNLRIFDDVKHWAIVNGRITPEDVLAAALALLPADSGQRRHGASGQSRQANSGVKGKAPPSAGGRLRAAEAVPGSSISSQGSGEAKPRLAFAANPRKALRRPGSRTC